MTLTNRILAFTAGLILWTGSVTWVALEMYRRSQPEPVPTYQASLPVPFEDPPGITPQMRIDQTWDCLRRARRPMGCD